MNNSIGREISILSRQFNIYIARELKELGIMTSEYIFIVNIESGSKCSQQDLCDYFVIDKAAATRAVSSLVEKGLVMREKNSSDRREYILSLTEKGEQIKPLIQEKLSNWTKILGRGLSEEQIVAQCEELKKMREKAVEENGK